MNDAEPVEPAPRGSSSRLRLLGVLVSVLSLAGVIVWASTQEAPELPTSARGLLLVAAALGVYALATVIRAERWLALLRHAGILASRVDCYGLTAVGFMGNNVLPARAGDAMRAFYMSRRTSARIRDVVSSLVAERVLDVAILLAVYAAVAYGLLNGIALPGASKLTTSAIIVGSVVLLAVAAAVVLHRLGRLAAIRELASTLLATTRRLRGGHGFVMVALTLAIWVAEALTLMLSGAAVGFEMTFLEGLYLIGLGGIFVLIPSGPGYAGTFDAAMLFGAKAIGASGGLALSFLLVARFVNFIPITVVGLVMMLLRYRSVPSGREPATRAAVGRR